ncbi:MAG: hypothetical protein JETT_1693 [Candidatus Jettenia ecosi]|uniref:Uncharacterized protein n=1 Tax=Candidatus Jettenia ecosi TaxID=2494326 RepID=A0A533QHB8_9BACT|nr:MAG: hypothetical protein JETT_1693 [Candidatus Jettenia ecosi]
MKFFNVLNTEIHDVVMVQVQDVDFVGCRDAKSCVSPLPNPVGMS